MRRRSARREAVADELGRRRRQHDGRVHLRKQTTVRCGVLQRGRGSRVGRFRTFPEVSGSFRKFPEVFRVRRDRVAAMRPPRRTRPQRGMALVRRCTDLELAARVRHGVGTQGNSGYSEVLGMPGARGPRTPRRGYSGVLRVLRGTRDAWSSRPAYATASPALPPDDETSTWWPHDPLARERARARGCVCVHARLRAQTCTCVRACVRAALVSRLRGRESMHTREGIE
jgi:hypothetical protein